jgi:hypothetical protein
MGIKNWLLGIYGAPSMLDSLDPTAAQSANLAISNFALAMSIPDVDEPTPLTASFESATFSTSFEPVQIGGGGWES